MEQQNQNIANNLKKFNYVQTYITTNGMDTLLNELRPPPQSHLNL